MENGSVQKTPSLFKRRDLIIAVGVVSAAIILFVISRYGSSGASADTATVRSDGKVICELSLSSDAEKTVESFGHMLTLTVRSGKIAVTKADCPDLVCVHTGFIGKAGETIVCIPARLSVSIGEGGGEYDAKTF